MVCLMDTVVSRLDDRGMASVCVCDWSHMFNSCWTMQPIPLFIDWKLILLRASFMLHCVRVNSIARHHSLVIALHALGDFYMLDVCCSLCLPLQKASPEICCSVIKKTPILHLQMLYLPEDQLRSEVVLFYAVWVLHAFNRHTSPTSKSMIPHMLLLGIGPCVSMCDQLSACHGVDLQCASPVYFRTISHSHSATHFWVRKVRPLSLWHFHLTRSPRALALTSMFPVPHTEAQYQPLNI